MGHIKEPDGIDFIVESRTLTAEDKKQISQIISYYKRTGRKMPLNKSTQPSRVVRRKKKTAA